LDNQEVSQVIVPLVTRSIS